MAFFLLALQPAFAAHASTCFATVPLTASFYAAMLACVCSLVFSSARRAVRLRSFSASARSLLASICSPTSGSGRTHRVSRVTLW